MTLRLFLVPDTSQGKLATMDMDDLADDILAVLSSCRIRYP